MTLKLALAAGAVGVALFAGAAFAQGGGGRDMLAAADANGDGQITLAEITAARAEAFTRLDQNADGQLQGAEIRGRMARADANGDGVVTRAEFVDRPMPAMERFDANRDNVLDAAELQAARQSQGGRRGGQGA